MGAKVYAFPETVFESNEYRILSCYILAAGAIPSKLFVFAVPSNHDARHEIMGELTATVDPATGDGFWPHNDPMGRIADSIDWVEVKTEHRRKGIATQLWLAAEKAKGGPFIQKPITLSGRKFAKSIWKLRHSIKPDTIR